MSHPTADRRDRLPPDAPLTRGGLLRRCGSGGQRVAGLGTQPSGPSSR